MGLIKEPAEIDFIILSKIWTVNEEKEFSELIKKQKEERNKQRVRSFINDTKKTRPSTVW